MKNRLYFNNLYSSDTIREELFSSIKEEKKSIGYYNLPNEDISSILEYADSFNRRIKNIVVVGIGGSSLGAKAIYSFLKPIKDMKRRLLFFETTDPLNISELIKEIDMDKTHFIIISKSGRTVETISIFKYIYAKNQKSDSYTIITDKGSNLNRFAKSIGSKVFYIPYSVGGRFSVLSAVGLVPLALCGIDIKSLLKGAKKIKKSFFEDGEIKSTLLDKAIFYAKNHERYSINTLFAYSEGLKYFTEWYIQLWGESLGKIQKNSILNIGLTPIGLIGSRDQHSFLQLIMEGKRDKSVTFIKIREHKSKLKIPDITLPNLETLDILNGIEFGDLINIQCDSTIEAILNKRDIPTDEVIISRVDEKSIGELIYYYELLTSLVGNLLNIDTYNQNGVEAGKIILKEKLVSLKR